MKETGYINPVRLNKPELSADVSFWVTLMVIFKFFTGLRMSPSNILPDNCSRAEIDPPKTMKPLIMNRVLFKKYEGGETRLPVFQNSRNFSIIKVP